MVVDSCGLGGGAVVRDVFTVDGTVAQLLVGDGGKRLRADDNSPSESAEK